MNAAEFKGGFNVDEDTAGFSIKTLAEGQDDAKKESLKVTSEVCSLVVEAKANTERYLQKARDLEPDLHSDDYRYPKACKYGGFELNDPVILGKLRSAIKYMVG